jgi:hypothetical protein
MTYVKSTITTVTSTSDKEKVVFQTLFKQFDGGPKKESEVVIRSSKEWKAFIDTCSTPETRKVLSGQTIEFDANMLIVVALGDNASRLGPSEKKHSGIQDIRSDKDGLVVDYCIVRTDVQNETASYAFHVITAVFVRIAHERP